MIEAAVVFISFGGCLVIMFVPKVLMVEFPAIANGILTISVNVKRNINVEEEPENVLTGTRTTVAISNNATTNPVHHENKVIPRESYLETVKS